MPRDSLRWLLIDASNHIYRDFHAAGPKALEIFQRRTDLMLSELRPDVIAVCFDSASSWRRDFDPTYKATRPPKPPGVAEVIAHVRGWCIEEALDVVDAAGFEADDAIATLAHMAQLGKQRVTIASSDKDLRQCLVAGAVNMLRECKCKGDRLHKEWTTADLHIDEYGVHPDQWADYQAIVGDRVDNVIGAQGIGGKTATQILRRCGSLDGYYRDPWPAQLTARQMAAMAAFKSRYEHVRRLVRLRRDVPLPAAWLEMVP